MVRKDVGVKTELRPTAAGSRRRREKRGTGADRSPAEGEGAKAGAGPGRGLASPPWELNQMLALLHILPDKVKELSGGGAERVSRRLTCQDSNLSSDQKNSR